MVKVGYETSIDNHKYAVQLDSDKNAFVYVPGGGSSGGGLTPEQTSQLTCLADNLGENCEKYITNINGLGSSIDNINNILDNNSQILNQFTCYNDKKYITKDMYDFHKYQVVMIPVDYSYKYTSQFFIVPAAPVSDPYKYCRKIYINEVTEVSAMLLSSVDSGNIHYATEFSEDSYILKDNDGIVVETSAASDLNEYDIVVRVKSQFSLEPLEVGIVKITSGTKEIISIYDASNKEAAQLKLGSNVVPDSDNEDLYISYVDINYSILEKFNEINQLYGYSTVNIAENTSILIPANSTKLIKIDTPQYQEYFAFSVKSFNTTDNDIDLIQASVFSDKAYLTLFNNSTNDKTIQEANNITIDLLYLKKEYVHRIN